MTTAQATTNHLGGHYGGFDLKIGTGGFGNSADKYGCEYEAKITHREIDLSINPFSEGTDPKEAKRVKLFFNDPLINENLNEVFRVTKGGFKSLGVKVYEVMKESINKKGEVVKTRVALVAKATYKNASIEIYSERAKKCYLYVNGGHINNLTNYLSRL